MTATQDSIYALRPDGSIALPDDDGDPAYYVHPGDAEGLADFIYANLTAIRQAQEKTRRVTAYTVLSQCITSGLPAPTSTRLRWDGLLVLDVDTDENYATWEIALTGVDVVEEHPTLGHRRSHKTSHLIIEGRWVADVETVDATAGAS